MNPFKYSIWLMPCAEQCAALRQTIDSLAARFQTPPFAPHTTLCSGVWNKEESQLTGLVDRLAAELPATLTANGIDWTDCWASSFLLRLSGAGDLFERAVVLVDGSHPPSIGPHLSLLYSFTPAAINRAALRQELACRLPPVIRFDALALARLAAGRWEDVQSWEIFHAASMDG